MACVFCEIVAGGRPARIVGETDTALGFLDHRPLFPGHVLVVPRAHHETLADLPDDELGSFFALVQRFSVAVPAAVSALGTFVANNNVVSQSVPHLHVHVVPRNRKDGLRGFFWPRNDYDDDAHRDAVADEVRAAFVATARA